MGPERRWAVAALWLFKCGFVLSAAVIFVLAVMPAHSAPSLLPWDKAQHFLAFYVLTVVAGAAFARSPIVLIGALMIGFGGAIELVQAIPFVHRDAEWGDLFADTVGVLAAALPLVLASWRRAWRPGS